MEAAILCIVIFIFRACDVVFATIRTIEVVKGRGFRAALAGFTETLIWFLIVREALLTEIQSSWIPIAYAGGYGFGAFCGTFIANRFIGGSYGVQVVLSKQEDDIIDEIRKEGYGVSVIDIKGRDEFVSKHMLFMEVEKKRFEYLKSMIKSLDDKAFIVVNETKMVHNGFFK